MALAAIKTWVDEVLEPADLNAEFANIRNNALSLISPLTGNLDFGGFRAITLSAGTVGNPSIQPTGDTNTGIYFSAADTIDFALAGARVSGFKNGKLLHFHTLETGAAVGDIVLRGAESAYRFVNAAETTSANFGMASSATPNQIDFNVPANTDFFNFKFAGSSRVQFYEENGGCGIRLTDESSAPQAAPSPNQVKLYIKDNGAGKTQLIALFNTGAEQEIAIQP